MSTVVDASVLVRALVDSGPGGEWAEAVIEGGSLHAPELARVEAANVLRRLERAKDITPAEAVAAYEDLMQLNIELFSFENLRGACLGAAPRPHQLRRVVRCGRGSAPLALGNAR